MCPSALVCGRDLEEDDTDSLGVEECGSAANHVELGAFYVDLQEVDPVDRVTVAVLVERRRFDESLGDRRCRSAGMERVGQCRTPERVPRVQGRGKHVERDRTGARKDRGRHHADVLDLVEGDVRPEPTEVLPIRLECMDETVRSDLA